MTAIEWSEGAAGPVLAALASEEPRDWEAFAACAETDPEAWFPEKGASVREAMAICGRCFVRAECLDYALDHDERFGIWGGTTARRRRQIRAQRSAA